MYLDSARHYDIFDANMTLQLKKSGSYTYLYAIKSFRKEDGRCTTKVVEKFGTVEELREKLGGEDPIEWRAPESRR